MTALEVWGGVECSVNRVGNHWHDQLELSGHAARLDDLDRIRALGIRTLRYPVLWERVSPNSPTERDWRWADERLSKLRSLGIQPIVGLVHHGSGPRYTGLLEENFAPQLALFAAELAARYPWVTHFTPVNEPLTTARFSGLYGLWYPHHKDERSFARALINQCRAIRLSMEAIRRINPSAELIQTEDLGTTFSTPHMRYQRDFDNERRWLSWDLLCGRIVPSHPLRTFLIGAGIGPAELDEFISNPCPPQVLGINHYVTSDRYLDERLSPYPHACHGQNSRERYADVEAVRVVPHSNHGWRVIQDAASRYDLPVALTEVHLGCTREEQLRWFHEAWTAARRARRHGCDVRAVTAWSLFGAYNWDTLLTRTDGSYEPGAFDVRAPTPRPTALSRLIARAAVGQESLDRPFALAGWWQRPEKLLYRLPRDRKVRWGSEHQKRLDHVARQRPILLCGAGSALGESILQACTARNIACWPIRPPDLSPSSLASIRALCETLRPWAIVNAAGCESVEKAEADVRRCFQYNYLGTGMLASLADDCGAAFVTFSTDQVFDGELRSPYVESSVPNPLNELGRSKMAGDLAALAFPQTLCIRTAALFGAADPYDFLMEAVPRLRATPQEAALSALVSPTYIHDLANASLDLLVDRLFGLIHVVNQGAMSGAGFVKAVADSMNVDIGSIAAHGASPPFSGARRPLYSVLESERASTMATLGDAIKRFGASRAAVVGRPARERASLMG